jgi:hypothetical protein
MRDSPSTPGPAVVISRDEWIERKRQWEIFNRWESEQPPVERAAEDNIADIGAILDWVPLEVLSEDPDPEKRGVQVLRLAFRYLKLPR